MLAVQRDGGRIGCAHLQRQEREIERRRPRAQRVEQRVRDALPTVLRRNGDIADVALIEHVQKVCVAEHRLPRSRDEKHVPVVRQLAGQLRARPRRGKARALERGELKPIKQNEAEATKCGMIKKEYGHIDFSRGKDAVHNLVRGMNPWPCAYAMLEGEAVKIWKTRHSDAEPSRGEPGLILRADRFNGILVDCGDGVIEILELQFPGAKRMDAASAVLGHKMGFKVFE